MNESDRCFFFLFFQDFTDRSFLFFREEIEFRYAWNSITTQYLHTTMCSSMYFSYYQDTFFSNENKLSLK